MEHVGAERIFSRSIEKRQLRSTGFYGDGDSKAFAMVEHIYEDNVVIKYECIGHYQKRVGNRLRKLKKQVSGLKELTETMIDKLQNYFGIALRSNVITVEAMSGAILASLFHVASSSRRNLHSHCEKGAKSWCQYQRDVANGTNMHKPGPGLSDKIIAHVKPIYQDLVKPEVLKRCLHGLTQNQNESFNSMIWERAPKYRYCGFDKLEFAVYDAVANFNDGRQATLDIYKMLNVDPGHNMLSACSSLNIKRRRSASLHSSAAWKKKRKIIRAEKKNKTDKNKSRAESV